MATERGIEFINKCTVFTCYLN